MSTNGNEVQPLRGKEKTNRSHQPSSTVATGDRRGCGRSRDDRSKETVDRGDCKLCEERVHRDSLQTHMKRKLKKQNKWCGPGIASTACENPRHSHDGGDVLAPHPGCGSSEALLRGFLWPSAGNGVFLGSACLPGKNCAIRRGC